eukprot:1073845-Pelagomonas_calceolata.AAC.1
MATTPGTFTLVRPFLLSYLLRESEQQKGPWSGKEPWSQMLLYKALNSFYVFLAVVILLHLLGWEAFSSVKSNIGSSMLRSLSSECKCLRVEKQTGKMHRFLTQMQMDEPQDADGYGHRVH